MKDEVKPSRGGVDALVETLVSLEPAEAERRLDAVCAGDVTLREDIATFLSRERTTRRGLRAKQEAAITVNPSAVGPARLGRYALLGKLGEGGMGVVYEGYDERLDRHVALKLLRKDESHREWLIREGQALARLAHPNVVAVHEVGEADGQIFLAMELVQGSTLGAFIERNGRGADGFAAVLRLFMEAGRGLAAAHDAGLVHRDFKPDNVIVGNDGRARVVDFGIAAMAQDFPGEPSTPRPAPSSALSSPLTQNGAIVGTPAFMAPEQFRGERATAGSDQWSFCVALYRAAYRTAPFGAESAAELSVRVNSEPPATPPRDGDAPAWLEPILLRGLERKPASRYASMHELLAAVEEHLPRDPELDPSAVIRERQVLSGFFLLGCAALMTPMLFADGRRLLTTPTGLALLPSSLLLMLGVLVFSRRQKIARNRYGRRMAWLFGTGLAAVVVNRLVGLALGLSPSQILVEELVVSATVYSIGAHMETRWLGWLGFISVVAAGVAARAPEQAPLIYGVGGLLHMTAMAIRLFVDRHLRASPDDDPARMNDSR